MTITKIATAEDGDFYSCLDEVDHDSDLIELVPEEPLAIKRSASVIESIKIKRESGYDLFTFKMFFTKNFFFNKVSNSVYRSKIIPTSVTRKAVVFKIEFVCNPAATPVIQHL